MKMQMNFQEKFQAIACAIMVLLLAAAAGCNTAADGGSATGPAVKQKAVIYKSPTCGCCVEYAAYLKENGFDVEIKSYPDLTPILNKYKIPSSMESCHTMVIGDYFVEGHVPLEAVYKMLEEQPDIDGISLPRMPAGSPGMPGVKRQLFRIYSLTDGETSDYVTI